MWQPCCISHVVHEVHTSLPTQALLSCTTVVHGPWPPLGPVWDTLTLLAQPHRHRATDTCPPCSLLLLYASAQMHPPYQEFHELELM